MDLLERNIESLEIADCSSLKKLAPPSMSFQNLTTLIVDQCDVLFILVTSSIARSFVQLIAMRIQNCKMIEEIVADEGDEPKDEISCNCLASLELMNLESMKSFCSTNFTFNFPSLKGVIIRNCPKMGASCLGVLITPMLKVVETEEGDAWEDNLNTTIQQLFTDGMCIFFHYLFPLKKLLLGLIILFKKTLFSMCLLLSETNFTSYHLSL